MYARGAIFSLLGIFVGASCSPSLSIETDGGFDAPPLFDADADDRDVDLPSDGDMDVAATDGDADGDVDSEADLDVEADADGDGDHDWDGDVEEEPRECLPEVCFDGLDNDCNGSVDDGCSCEPGESAPCFRGDPRHRGLGACRDGEMLCTGTYEFGEWGACEGDVAAVPEVCDAAGVDEDCDGAPNDGCECVDGDPELECGTDVGTCEMGIQHCLEGHWTECAGAVGPEVEICDGLDNDCDGVIDDDLVRTCGSDVGACRPGTETCSEGEWGECLGDNPPADEVCDGLDNDCDGEIDEDVTRSCGSDTGRCVAGTETCAEGVFGDCVGAIDPVGETCNDVDDDCDGETDEALTRRCGTDIGSCVSGTETCVEGGWGACEGVIWPVPEACDGLLDENCDGTVDEGCDCTSGETRPCGIDTGLCERGSQICDDSGSWGRCEGAIEAVSELCNGEDDDCDGETDEGCECILGDTRSCGIDEGLCETGLETCDELGRWSDCVGEVEPEEELCNGEDDDCDGEADEDDVCPRFPPVVRCPEDEDALVGTPVELIGEGSDPDGGDVTFAWSIASRPVGSAATPEPDDASTTELTPDVEGVYNLRLCVVDDEHESRCCTVRVTAEPICEPPAGFGMSSCETSWDRRPIVEFPPLPAEIVYELFVEGDPLPFATIEREGQNYFRPDEELGSGAAPPAGEELVIFARACTVGDDACCTVSEATTVRLIEECAEPIVPTSANIVFSEYVINGDGECPGPDCEAGEAIEITNLSHCPVSLDGFHFGYCNPPCTTYRWMDFGPEDVIPPRGVYVAIRAPAGSSCEYPFFGPDEPGLFGLRISALAMEGTGLWSGWFNNGGGRDSVLRIATGEWSAIDEGDTLEIISPYSGAAPECSSIGFNAMDECGNVSALSTPSDTLTPNQLGRLWHPCDAVLDPFPVDCM